MPDPVNFSDFIVDLLQIKEKEIKTIALKRYEYLTRAGDVERHLYWVESGALRAIYLSAEEEHSIRFGYAGSLINALPSYFSAQPSELYVQALRETVVKAIPRHTILSYVESDADRGRSYRLLLELLAVQQNERELDLLTSSPMQRLQRVMQRSPKVFQEIPAKYIASYLRMTPETLSRLRKELNS